MGLEATSPILMPLWVYGSEQADINRGVGGAPKGARPITVPNFNFGGGQRGTMVANSSEYIVPNFGGGSGSAIFNQNMVSSMGLPAGARKIGAAGGYVPNFAQKPPLVKVTHAGMIVPQKGRAPSQAQGTFGGVTYQFPVYGIDAGGEKVREEAGLKRDVKAFAIGQATQEAKTMTGGKPRAGKIGKLSNQGAIGSLAGAIFETALSALLRSNEFDFGETATFDFVGPKAVRDIGDISPSLKSSPVKFLEAKIGSNPKTNISMAKKIQRYFGKTASGKTLSGRATRELMGAGGGTQKQVLGTLGMGRGRGASGYIPNYASPLEDAINREQAAGLPISQIRINQDSGLRGAGNPMGLAVTNMRDEPTGAIPNYARVLPKLDMSKGFKMGATAPPSPGVQRDLLGPIFAVTAAMSALQGATSGAEEGLAKFTNITANALAGMTTAAFAGTAIMGMGKSMQESGGKFKKGMGGAIKGLAGFGMALGVAAAAWKMGVEIFNQTTGANKRAALATANLADATDKLSIKFGDLSQSRQAEISMRAGAVVTQGTVGVPKHLSRSSSHKTLGISNRMWSSLLNATLGRGGGTRRAPIASGPMVTSEEKRFFGVGDAGKELKQAYKDLGNDFMALGGTAVQLDEVLDSLGKDLSDKGDFKKALEALEKRNQLTIKESDDFNKMLDSVFDLDAGGLASLQDTFALFERSPSTALQMMRDVAGPEFKTAGGQLSEEIKIKIIKERIKKLTDEVNKTTAEGKRLELEAQKKILKAALELSRLKITDTTETQKQIKNAQILGNLTGKN